MNDLNVFEDVSNPLDSVEEILCANDWVFNRSTEDELHVQITGNFADYDVHFLWCEDESVMHLTCNFDLQFQNTNLNNVFKTIMAINSDLWLGHFDLHDYAPRFRHTSLFRGMTYGSGTEHVQDLIEIALSECERYYPVFDVLAKMPADNDNEAMALKLALMDSVGSS